jgi:hypothetical protein
MVRFIGMMAAAAITGLALAGSARAAPELGDTVYSPYIEDGETSVEIRAGRSVGGPADADSGQTIEFEHGFNSWFSGALVGELEQHPHEYGKVDSLGFETVFGYLTLPVVDVDTGLYVEYQQRLHDESGVGEVKLLFAKRVGAFEGRLNLNMVHPFTTKAHTEYDYAASGEWALTRDARVGAEFMGELGFGTRFGGALQHYAGPLFKYDINGIPYVGVKFETAYLFALGGAGRSDNGQVRVGVELEKRF